MSKGWPKGKPRSEETKRKISERLAGRPNLALKGKRLSEEHKSKLREARARLKKQQGFLVSLEARSKIGEKLKGRKRPYKKRGPLSDETKKKISEAQIGSKNHRFGKRSPNWKGGRTSKNKLIRNSAKYQRWRTDVFERDNFTCQRCGVRGGRLEADHIKQFAYYPELRFDLGNGRTLCKGCHKQTETYNKQRRIRITNDVDELLACSDIVSINIELAGNEGFFTKAMLQQLKPTAYLVNTSRGGVVERGALKWALENGVIAGAAVDFTDDPELIAYATQGRYYRRPRSNLILTNHLGGCTVEDMAATEEFVTRKVERYLVEQKLT